MIKIIQRIEDAINTGQYAPSRSSYFKNIDEAEMHISDAINSNRANIQAWIRDPNSFKADFILESTNVGRGNNRIKPEFLNIPIRNLDYSKVRFTQKGIDVITKHLSRFGYDGPNAIMIERLQNIVNGKIKPTEFDYKFYTHEAREYIRFRKGGYEKGMAPDDFYQTQHGATLEDYNIPDNPRSLYHPDAQSHPDF